MDAAKHWDGTFRDRTAISAWSKKQDYLSGTLGAGNISPARAIARHMHTTPEV